MSKRSLEVFHGSFHIPPAFRFTVSPDTAPLLSGDNPALLEYEIEYACSKPTECVCVTPCVNRAYWWQALPPPNSPAAHPKSLTTPPSYPHCRGRRKGHVVLGARDNRLSRGQINYVMIEAEEENISYRTPRLSPRAHQPTPQHSLTPTCSPV